MNEQRTLRVSLHAKTTLAPIGEGIAAQFSAYDSAHIFANKMQLGWPEQ